MNNAHDFTAEPTADSNADSQSSTDQAANQTHASAGASAKSLRYLVAHSTCAMCETKLEIRHEINKNEWKLKEEAHCPSCGIRVRSAHHLLH